MPLNTYDEYLESLSPEIQALMLSIQQKAETLLPGLTRCINYQVPAFRASKGVFFYFAAFKKHIGAYHPSRKIQG
jgi:uncharacterized protein YdhG (YjbR/CyaY superfamily)